MALRPGLVRRQLGQRLLVQVIAPNAQVVDPAAVEDREQPARQAFGLAQLLDPRQAARQGFLGQVVGEGRIVAPGEGDAIQPAAARLDFFRQLALLPRLQPFHRISLPYHYDAAHAGFIPWPAAGNKPGRRRVLPCAAAGFKNNH
jgi:hypothetical protein